MLGVTEPPQACRRAPRLCAVQGPVFTANPAVPAAFLCDFVNDTKQVRVLTSPKSGSWRSGTPAI